MKSISTVSTQIKIKVNLIFRRNILFEEITVLDRHFSATPENHNDHFIILYTRRNLTQVPLFQNTFLKPPKAELHALYFGSPAILYITLSTVNTLF